MQIKGFQKLTLLDYPGKMACTVFTGGCNFRCPFCHNASLVLLDSNKQDNFSEEEILKHLMLRKGVLDGICITGGEPLVQSGLEEFIAKVKALGFLVKLDTNGSFPDRLRHLINNNLIDYVAMDIKNSLGSYGKTIGVDNFNTATIQESVKILMESKIDYEFRTTVTQELHTKEDFELIGKWLKGSKAYYLQNFVDSGDVICDGLHPMSKNELIDAKNTVKQYIEKVEIRGE